MTKDEVQVISVIPRSGSGGGYTVKYVDWNGEATSTEVYASDEMAAYAWLVRKVEHDRVTTRITVVCGTLSLLGAFLLIGGSCSFRESVRKETIAACVAAGKKYVENNTVTSCI